MSIQNEITRIANGVTAAKTAITSKGGTVSTTSVDDLATEIATIPSGQSEPTEPSLYGRVTYYKNKKVVVDGELMCEMCTAEIVDEDKFSEFMSQQQGASMLDMMYEQGQWRVNWETVVEDPLEEMGMQIELAPGADFAMINGQLKGSYYGRFIYDFESLDEIDGLCSDQTKTIDGEEVENAAIIDFEWGTTTPTEIGDYFMANSAWNKPSIPSTVVSIGDNFISNAKIPSDTDIVIDDSSSVETIGNGFCAFVSLRTLSLFGENTLTVGDYFCSEAIIRNAYFGIPLSFGNHFLDSSFIKSISNVGSFTNVTSTGDYFLCNSRIPDANAIVSAMGNLTSIGGYFCSESIGLTNITVPSTVTSVGSNFLFAIKTLSVVNVNTSAHPTGISSLSISRNTEPSYTRGILVTGTYASTWKNALPDRTSSPYRKLVLS